MIKHNTRRFLLGALLLTGCVSMAGSPLRSNAQAPLDTTAPTISSLSASPNVLWPPNHKMILVTVNYNLSDPDSSASASLSAFSNEPVNGKGDGNTSPDIQIVDAHHLYLRAERSGKGQGRVYTIIVTATDLQASSSLRLSTS